MFYYKLSGFIFFFFCTVQPFTKLTVKKLVLADVFRQYLHWSAYDFI